jgi:hypothetical protein
VGPLSVSTAAIDMMRVGAEREPESARNGRNKVKKKRKKHCLSLGGDDVLFIYNGCI